MQHSSEWVTFATGFQFGSGKQGTPCVLSKWMNQPATFALWLMRIVLALGAPNESKPMMVASAS